ncbi:MAG: TraR/DksA C4-type zinc finger protein [Caldilineaceae bacterium]|nr:TraR/DksA C4-type zinc finger protein [Caldilineaceae bacterium]
MAARQQTAEQARLHREREVAMEELGRLWEMLQVEIDLEPDEGDAQITEHRTAAILAAMLEHKVQEIDSALFSIEMGQYGACERCGKPVEAERLAAKPHARYCIACQEIVERATHEVSAKQVPDEVFLSIQA